MPTMPVRALVAIAALAISAAACSGPGDTEGAATTTAPPETSAPPISSPTDDDGDAGGNGQGGGGGGDVAEVLRFSAPELGGGTIEGEDFSGTDVAFWFWAPW